jgi:hypothetical protein
MKPASIEHTSSYFAWWRLTTYRQTFYYCSECPPGSAYVTGGVVGTLGTGFLIYSALRSEWIDALREANPETQGLMAKLKGGLILIGLFLALLVFAVIVIRS